MSLRVLKTLLMVVGLLWPLAEVLLAVTSRARRGSAKGRDRGSLILLFVSISVGIAAANVLNRVLATRIPVPLAWLLGLALILLLSGLAVRLTAIIMLGRFFSSAVTIQDQHRIVSTGMYRRVRHPSYSGLLLAVIGIACSYGNWLSLAGLVVPTTAAVLYRIHVEERAMMEAFGQEYADYRSRTRRLIPGIY
jgi:protein-S-isoprenylcysteine O-methyltransferase Ste14